jgi:hypothetical protein
MNNINQQQQQRQLQNNFFNKPVISKLYDLCIKMLIENNFYSILTKQPNNQQLKLRIKLPSTILDSILVKYFTEFEMKLKIFERNAYFMIKNQINKQNCLPLLSESDLQFETQNLISYYDLLKCFANENILETTIYKPCIRVQNHTNYRLNKILETKQTILTASQNHFISMIGNLRSTYNPQHLCNSDIDLLCTNKIEYLDICPCMLTNRVIGLINLNFKYLKSLKLQNYCNMKSENDSTCNNLFSPIVEEKREDTCVEKYRNKDENIDDTYVGKEKLYCVNVIKEQFFILNLENLQYLSLKGMANSLSMNYLNELLVKFKQLKYLDLTDCFKLRPMNMMGHYIKHDSIEAVISVKPNLSKSLKHLYYYLQSLDISGTNLIYDGNYYGHDTYDK